VLSFLFLGGGRGRTAEAGGRLCSAADSGQWPMGLPPCADLSLRLPPPPSPSYMHTHLPPHPQPLYAPPAPPPPRPRLHPLRCYTVTGCPPHPADVLLCIPSPPNPLPPPPSPHTPPPDVEPGQLRLLDVDERLVLPTNSLIRVLVTAADVIHSWAVPSLGVKIDAIPGRLNQVRGGGRGGVGVCVGGRARRGKATKRGARMEEGWGEWASKCERQCPGLLRPCLTVACSSCLSMSMWGPSARAWTASGDQQ
jgi:hypothetical protein